MHSVVIRSNTVFFLENRYDKSSKLSPKGTVCMNCQMLFSGKKLESKDYKMLPAKFFTMCAEQ